jgi:MFS family permease
MNEVSTPTEPATDRLGQLKRRVIIGVIGLVVLVGGWYIGAAVMPRWWAQRLGDLIDGRLTLGTFLGVVLGSVFAVLPLVALWSGWRFRRTWRRAAGTFVVALLLAAPNLLTLGIVVGDGNAAHAGERILDVDGPGLRGGTLVGAVVGVLAALAFTFLVKSRARNKRKFRELRSERKQELREREADAAESSGEE